MFQALRKAVSGNYTNDPRNSLVQDEYRKKNLKENLALSIKNLQKAHINGVTVVERNDGDAENICQALEAIFLHEYQMQAHIIPNNINFNLRVILSEGIKPDDSVVSIAFWDLLKEVTHNDVVAELKHLVVTTEVGLCRAWIRLAINDCLFLSYLDAILSNTSLVKRYYRVNAFLMDCELPFLLKELLQGLLQFEFRLNYNSSKLNTWDNKTLQLAGIVQHVKHKGKSTRHNPYVHNPQANTKRAFAITTTHNTSNIDVVKNNLSTMCPTSTEEGGLVIRTSCKKESDERRRRSTSKHTNNPSCSKWKDSSHVLPPVTPKDKELITATCSTCEGKQDLAVTSLNDADESKVMRAKHQQVSGKLQPQSQVVSHKCNMVRNEELQQNDNPLIPSKQRDTDKVIPSNVHKTDKDDRNVSNREKLAVDNSEGESELMLQLNENTSNASQNTSNLPRASLPPSKILIPFKKEGDKISAQSSPQNCGDDYSSACNIKGDKEQIKYFSSEDNNMLATNTNGYENMQAQYCGDNPHTSKDNRHMIRNISPAQIAHNSILSAGKTEHTNKRILPLVDKGVKNGSKAINKDESMLCNIKNQHLVSLDQSKLKDICANNVTVSGCEEELPAERNSTDVNDYAQHTENKTNDNSTPPQDITEGENSHTQHQFLNVVSLNNKLCEDKGLSTYQSNELCTKGGSKHLLPQSESTVCDAPNAEIIVFEESANRIIDSNVSANNIDFFSEVSTENGVEKGDGLILNGNRLNGMGWSGWSSSFDNTNDVEDVSGNDDSDSPDSDYNNEQLNESFGSLLQMYGNSPNYVHAEYLRTQCDTSKGKEAVQEDAVLEERVTCSPHNDSQLVQLNFELVLLDAPLQGQNIDKKTLSSINQLTHIASEVGLDKQAFSCQHCGVLIGLIYGPYRVCRYDGHYYCYDCHDDEEHIIPARVIQEWDFRKYKVSKYNKLFLMKIEEEPLFHMDEINLLLYGVVTELCEMKNLRIQLQHIKEYVQTCRHEVAEDFRRRLWPREYLCDDVHQYSLLDLVQVYNGQQAHHLKKIIAQFSKHIFKCTLCCQKGFICEYCHDSTIIYPFQVDIAVQCPGCLATFHKVCRQDKRCPKCVRVRLRSQSVGKQENDGIRYVNQKEPCSNSDIL